MARRRCDDARADLFPRRWETDAQWGEVQQFRNRAYDPGSGRWLQEDPIGVAGGINLYEYIGNDPVTWRDPFGLLEVRYGSDAARAEVDALRRKSSSFDKALRRAERDPTLLVVFAEGSTSPCGGSGGCARYMGVNAKGQKEFHVLYHKGGIAGDDALFRMGPGGRSGANVSTTLAHEFYGHVVPGWNARVGFVCGDYVARGASSSCAVKRENVIRREIGVPLRTVN